MKPPVAPLSAASFKLKKIRFPSMHRILGLPMVDVITVIGIPERVVTPRTLNIAHSMALGISKKRFLSRVSSLLTIRSTSLDPQQALVVRMFRESRVLSKIEWLYIAPAP